MSDLFGGQNSSFCYYKKSFKQHGQGIFWEIFKKKSLHFEEESCELIKIFEGFGQIFNFLLLKFSHLANRFQRYINMCWILKFFISLFFL